jgi:hypothetical protein
VIFISGEAEDFISTVPLPTSAIQFPLTVIIPHAVYVHEFITYIVLAFSVVVVPVQITIPVDIGLHVPLRCVVYALRLVPVPKKASIICPLVGFADRNLCVTNSKLFHVILPVVPMENNVKCGELNVRNEFVIFPLFANSCQVLPSLE